MVALAIAGVALWVMYINSLERPAYKVIKAEGRFEVRDYPPMVVAEIVRAGSRDSAVNAGFRPLADYIFAKNRSGDGIAMTAPVTQSAQREIAMTAPVTQSRTPDPASQSSSGTRWTIRFIMPSKYKLADLPRPARSDVTLSSMPARRVAAIWFSGVATDELLAGQEGELKDWIVKQGLKPQGGATFAYYNDPFTPGILRRNEVMFYVSE